LLTPDQQHSTDNNVKEHQQHHKYIPLRKSNQEKFNPLHKPKQQLLKPTNHRPIVTRKSYQKNSFAPPTKSETQQ